MNKIKFLLLLLFVVFLIKGGINLMIAFNQVLLQ